MKKSILLIFVSLLILNKSYSQITRDNWMVGGDANFSFNNSNTGATETKTTTINVAPNIGYFFADKFAGGIRLSIYKNNIKFGPPDDNYTTFSYYNIGPFVRYYLLNVENRGNIVTEVSYQFGKEKSETSYSLSSYNSNKFSLSAGPVIYFNTSVGIEFLLNYSSLGNNVNSKRANSFGIGIGLQVHLQKEKT